jgi:hypothetical protein
LDGLLPVFHENTKPSASSLCADVICARKRLDAANEASMIAALGGCENGFDPVQGLVSGHWP